MSSRVAVAVLVLAAVVLVGCTGGSGAAATSPPAPPPTRADVAYAPTSPSQVLDLWVPASTPAPLVAFLHGGGFLGGDKRAVRGMVRPLLDAGYAVASVDYRLSAEARFPAAPRDAKAAVRHLRGNAAAYGLDPGRFVAWGESAGGNLASMVGLTGDRRTVLDDDALGGVGVSSAVQAVVDWYGATDFPRRESQARAGSAQCRNPQLAQAGRNMAGYLGGPVETVPRVAAEASPVTWVATAVRTPPFSIAHGTADCLVPVAQSRMFADALTAAGHRPDLRLLDGARHGDPRFAAELLSPTIRWLDAVLRR